MGRKLFENLKMRHKIVLVSVITIMMLWITTVGVAVSGIHNIYNKKIDRIIQQTVEQTSRYVSTEYINIINLVHYSVNMDELQTALRAEINNNQKEYIYAQSIIGPILTQLRIQNKFIESAGLIIKDEWFYSDNYLMHYDTDELMRQVRQMPLIYWSKEPVLNQATSREVLPIVMKLPSGGTLNADHDAYMAVNIDTKKMFEYLHELEQNLQCYLLIHDEDEVIYGNRELFLAMNDHQYIVNNTEIAINGWTLTCMMERQAMYQDMNQTIINMLIISIVIAFICIFMANYVSASITIPIYRLADQTKKLEHGDFTARCDVHGKDEIAELSNSFNAMSSQIESYIQMLEAEKKQLKISEEKKRKAEMQALQSQINPHFLYNTLDSLYWYSLSGKKAEIGQIVVDLSMLLRIGLSKGAETITIEKEIKHVEHYLKIQKLIFGERFDYQIVADEQLYQYPIIKILLQPLVENCINHGFANLEAGGEIEVSISQQNELLVMSVTDNGDGFKQTDVSASEYSGYALSNISQRLALHYDTDAAINITSEPDRKTTVTITIQLKRLISDGGEYV